MSACPSARNNSAPTEQICTEFDIWVFLENLSRKFKFHSNLTRTTRNLHEDQYKFLIISRSFLFRLRNDSDKPCREKQNTYFLCSTTFFENRTVYEVMWKNFLESSRPQMSIWCMNYACWIPKATNTPSEYAIIIAFPLQQLLQEVASMLRCTAVHCLSCYLYWRSTEFCFVVADSFRNLSPSVQENVEKFKITNNPFFPFHRKVLVHCE